MAVEPGSPEDDLVVDWKEIAKIFHPPPGRTTVYEWAESGVVVRARRLKGRYLLNRTRIENGLKPVNVREYLENLRSEQKRPKPPDSLHLISTFEIHQPWITAVFGYDPSPCYLLSELRKMATTANHVFPVGAAAGTHDLPSNPTEWVWALQYALRGKSLAYEETPPPLPNWSEIPEEIRSPEDTAETFQALQDFLKDDAPKTPEPKQPPSDETPSIEKPEMGALERLSRKLKDW